MSYLRYFYLRYVPRYKDLHEHLELWLIDNQVQCIYVLSVFCHVFWSSLSDPQFLPQNNIYELCDIYYGMINNNVNLSAMVPPILTPLPGMPCIAGRNNLRQFDAALPPPSETTNWNSSGMQMQPNWTHCWWDVSALDK